MSRSGDLSREAQVLEVVRELLDAGLPFRNRDVVDGLERWIGGQGGRIEPLSVRGASALVSTVLRSLEAMGHVQRRDGAITSISVPVDSDETTERGRPDSDRQSSDVFEKGSNNLPPPPKTPDAAGGDNGNGRFGDGYREVLSHPYLFSLPEDRFEELLLSIGEPC